MRKFVFLFIFMVLPVAGIALDATVPNTVMVFSNTSVGSMRESVKALSSYGFNSIQLLGDRVLIGTISGQNEVNVKKNSEALGVVSIMHGKVMPRMMMAFESNVQEGLGDWNYLYGPGGVLTPEGKRARLKLTRSVGKKRKDYRIPPSYKGMGTLIKPNSPPYGVLPGMGEDTSEYLIGNPKKPFTVAVKVILLESNGSKDGVNSENWPAENNDPAVLTLQRNVRRKILAAFDWWTRVAGPCKNVKFILAGGNYDTVNVGYEPIKHNVEEDSPGGPMGESLWMNDAMDYYGIAPNSDYLARVRKLADNIRLTYDTDWGFVIFVANSENDVDGEFNDGFSAYAYLGGPCVVMTTDNDGWTIDEMDFVCAHEIGHVFYALDEYLDPINNSTSPNQRSGYLNVQNLNHESLPTSNPCIMRCDTYAFDNDIACSFTRSMVGWRDSTKTGKMDITNTKPEMILTPFMPNPTNMTVLNYYGTARVTFLKNLNPYGNGRDIQVNTIESMDYSVDPITPLDPFIPVPVPLDGSYSYGSEGIMFIVGPLATNMIHTIEARCFCTTSCPDLLNISNIAVDQISILDTAPSTPPPGVNDCVIR